MTHMTRALGIGILVIGMLAARVDAGRIGGPMLDGGTLAPGQIVSFNVPFAAGAPASIAVMGNGAGNVDLYVFDGDGNVTTGSGAFERRVAIVNVYRAGYFRVELRNTGTVPSTVVVGTN
jgi:hypothetical protein